MPNFPRVEKLLNSAIDAAIAVVGAEGADPLDRKITKLLQLKADTANPKRHRLVARRLVSLVKKIVRQFKP